LQFRDVQKGLINFQRSFSAEGFKSPYAWISVHGRARAMQLHPMERRIVADAERTKLDSRESDGNKHAMQHGLRPEKLMAPAVKRPVDRRCLQNAPLIIDDADIEMRHQNILERGRRKPKPPSGTEGGRRIPQEIDCSSQRQMLEKVLRVNIFQRRQIIEGKSGIPDFVNGGKVLNVDIVPSFATMVRPATYVQSKHCHRLHIFPALDGAP